MKNVIQEDFNEKSWIKNITAYAYVREPCFVWARRHDSLYRSVCQFLRKNNKSALRHNLMRPLSLVMFQ